ncbi:MAG: glycosyltransferase family 4 protein [Patescibacteria group bacterium]
MKICIINNLYKPYNKGGAESVIENIATGLSSRGHKVVLITLGRENKTERLDGIRIYYINPWNIFSFLDIDKKPAPLRFVWWFFNVFNIFGCMKIKKILKQEDPEIAHLHNLTGIGFLVFRMIRKTKIQNILTLHDIHLAYPSGQLIYRQEDRFINKNILRFFYEKLVRFLVSSPDIVISPSQWLLDFYNNKAFFKNSKKYVLRNAVKQHSASDRQRIAKGGNLKFLFVGVVEEYKGIFLLLNIFSKLNYELDIVGGGKDLEKAKHFVKNKNLNNIIFYNKLDKNDLNKVYLKSDVLIFPSLTYENYPTVILEAFSYGLPVIASRIGGVPELVKDNITGWLFEPGNEKELHGIIKNINISDISRIKNNNFEKAIQFDLNKYLDEYTKICFNKIFM